MWRYLHSLFGGHPIKRYGTLIDERTEECIVEVYLTKIYIYDIPREDKQKICPILIPRNYTLRHLYDYAMSLRGVSKVESLRLWKIWRPEDINKYYNEIVGEYTRYNEVIIEGEILHLTEDSGGKLVGELEFSRDNILLIEHIVKQTTVKSKFVLIQAKEEHKDSAFEDTEDNS